jgi:plastocyanin
MKAGRIVLPAVIMSVVFGTGIGRTDEAASPKPSQPSVITVKIVMDAALQCEKAFDPSVVTIKAGTTVEWINQDSETHTVVSSKGDDPCRQTEMAPKARAIDVGQIPHLAQHRQTFTKAGEYRYACHLPFHQMSGKIIVVP